MGKGSQRYLLGNKLKKFGRAGKEGGQDAAEDRETNPKASDDKSRGYDGRSRPRIKVVRGREEQRS